MDQQFSYYVLSYATPPKKSRRSLLQASRKSFPTRSPSHSPQGLLCPQGALVPGRTEEEGNAGSHAGAHRSQGNPAADVLPRLPPGPGHLSAGDRDPPGLQGSPFLVEEGKRINRINLAVVAFDAEDEYVGGDEKAWNFKLGDSSYQALLESGLTSSLSWRFQRGGIRSRSRLGKTLNAGTGLAPSTVMVPLPADQDIMGTLEKTALRGLRSSEQHDDLNVDFKANFFYQDSEQALVLIAAKVSPGKVGNTAKSWLPGKDLRLMGVAFSEDGQGGIGIRPDSSAGKRQAESMVAGFLKLKPGKYRIKLVAADRRSNLGTAEQSLWIPALPPDALMTSGLVLSQELERFPSSVAGMQVPRPAGCFSPRVPG